MHIKYCNCNFQEMIVLVHFLLIIVTTNPMLWWQASEQRGVGKTGPIRFQMPRTNIASHLRTGYIMLYIKMMFTLTMSKLQAWFFTNLCLN